MTASELFVPGCLRLAWGRGASRVIRRVTRSAKTQVVRFLADDPALKLVTEKSSLSG